MLLDTSGLFCIHDQRDSRHKEAANFYRAARQMLTTSYVLTEFVALAHARGMQRAKTLVFLADLINVPRLEVVWVEEGLQQRAMDLLEARLDKTYSLCDAVSFVLMRERGVLEALTTDKHFEQEGFIRLLAA